MDNKKKIGIIGVLSISLGIFIFLSLLFYSVPAENSGEITNKMGIAGDLISRFMFQKTIGYACFIFPLLIIAWGLNFILSKKLAILKK